MKSRSNNTETIYLTEPYRLCVKHSSEALIPCCAVDMRWKRVYPKTREDWERWLGAKFLTSDGHLVQIEIVCGYNNASGGYDSEFEEICQRLYNLPFATIRSVWASRFPRMDNFWYLIRMYENNKDTHNNG